MEGQAEILPLPGETLIAVEYPGLVINTDRALATFGGCDAIGKAEAEAADSIEVRYSPEVCPPVRVLTANSVPRAQNLTSPAINGHRTRTNNLLLRVRKRSNQVRHTQHSL